MLTSRLCLLALLASAAGAWSCGKEAPSPLPAAKAVPVADAVQPAQETPAPAATPAPRPPAASGGRIVLDLSQSMAGYALANAASVEAVHLAMKAALSQSSVGPTDYCELGDQPDPLCGLPAEPARYRAAKTYAASRSNLATALAPRKQAQTAASNQPETAKLGLVDDRAVTILMTDGLEASAGTPREDIEINCQPGADAFCLRDVLVARSRQGFGIWVVAVSMPFNGRIFTERGLDDARFAQIQPHLDELTAQPGWEAIELTARNLKRNRKTHNDNYQYKGVRPMLLLVIAGEHARGRRVTEDLVRRLTQERVALPADRVAWVQVNGYQPGAFAWGPAAKVNAKVEMARSLIPLGAPQQGLRTVDQAFECHERQGGDFVQTALRRVAAPAPDPLPPGLVEDVAVTFDAGGSKAFQQFSPNSGHPAPVYRVAAVCKAVERRVIGKATVATGLRYHSTGTGWWHEWTATDTYAQPERVYLLSSLIDALLETAALPPQPQHQLRIALRPGEG